MKALLQIKNLNFKLPSGQVILSQINMQILPGEFVVLVGSNGSGKSSLIKLINRQYRLREGEICLNNEDIQKFSHKKSAEYIITLTQFVKDSLFVDLSLFENAKLITPFKSIDELKKYLSNFNPNLAEAVEKPVSELSGGEQQQLAFALYMTKQPKLLLLDEHTSALDPIAAEKIMQMTHNYVRQHHITCIMTTHNMDFAERFPDRLIAMKHGHLLQNVEPQYAFS